MDAIPKLRAMQGAARSDWNSARGSATLGARALKIAVCARSAVSCVLRSGAPRLAFSKTRRDAQKRA
eukprot:3863851-Pyramimonas_sp.AAC.1